MPRRVFVTVGDVLRRIDRCMHDTGIPKKLKTLGFDELRLQVGAAPRRPKPTAPLVPLRADITEEMRAADVVDHAGAGSILEALELGKRLEFV